MFLGALRIVVCTLLLHNNKLEDAMDAAQMLDSPLDMGLVAFWKQAYSVCRISWSPQTCGYTGEKTCPAIYEHSYTNRYCPSSEQTTNRVAAASALTQCVPN